MRNNWKQSYKDLLGMFESQKKRMRELEDNAKKIAIATKNSNEQSNCNITCVSNCPSELEPVLAKIEHINSLGKSSWYEVVYFDGNWRCYAGSSTFKDGEKVVKWRYCKDC